MTRIVNDLYRQKAARWFMRARGNAVLSPKAFDALVGFTTCVLVAPEAIER